MPTHAASKYYIVNNITEHWALSEDYTSQLKVFIKCPQILHSTDSSVQKTASTEAVRTKWKRAKCLKCQSVCKYPVNGLIDVIVSSKKHNWETLHRRLFLMRSLLWDFTVGSLSQVDLLTITGFQLESPEQRTTARSTSLRTQSLFCPLCTHRYTSVLPFDVSSIYWQFIWSKKFRNPARGVTTCCVSVSHRLHRLWWGNGESSAKRVLSPPAYKALKIHARIQRGLHFKCCNRTFWSGERQRDFIIHYKDQFSTDTHFLASRFSSCHSHSFHHIVTLTWSPGTGRHVSSHCEPICHPSLFLFLQSTSPGPQNHNPIFSFRKSNSKE